MKSALSCLIFSIILCISCAEHTTPAYKCLLSFNQCEQERASRMLMQADLVVTAEVTYLQQKWVAQSGGAASYQSASFKIHEILKGRCQEKVIDVKFCMLGDQDGEELLKRNPYLVRLNKWYYQKGELFIVLIHQSGSRDKIVDNTPWLADEGNIEIVKKMLKSL